MKASLLDSFSIELTAKKTATIYLGSSEKNFFLTNSSKGKSGSVVEVIVGQYSAKIHPSESMLVSGKYIQVGLVNGTEESTAAIVTAELVVSDI